MVQMMKSPAQFSARRGGLAVVNALAAVAFSTSAIFSAIGHHARDPLYFALWFVWMLTTLIWTFGVPGYWRWSAAQRAVINDELVKAHQAVAAKGALAVAVIGMGLLSVGTFFHLAVPTWTLPALTCATVVSAALIFGWLERRDACTLLYPEGGTVGQRIDAAAIGGSGAGVAQDNQYRRKRRFHSFYRAVAQVGSGTRRQRRRAVPAPASRLLI